MELAELLEREGLDPDALMTWARGRADTLVEELAHAEHGQPLLQLLVAEASVDVAALSVASTVAAARPISVDELPPPPEPQLAEGEPEPILETFDTGPIDLETLEAAALLGVVEVAPEAEHAPIAEASEPELPVAVEAEPAVEAELPVAAEPAGEDESSGEEDELEEIELDELVEIAEDELEVLDELDEPESPLPPRRPPPPEPAPIRTGDTASFAVVDQPPVRTGDTAAHSVVADGDDLEDVDLDAPPNAAADDDSFDLDLD
jgi:hypothetical protein